MHVKFLIFLVCSKLQIPADFKLPGHYVCYIDIEDNHGIQCTEVNSAADHQYAKRTNENNSEVIAEYTFNALPKVPTEDESDEISSDDDAFADELEHDIEL